MLKKRLNLTLYTLDVLNKFCLSNVYRKPSLKKAKLIFYSINNETVLQNKINLIIIFFFLFFKETNLKLKKNAISNNNLEKNNSVSNLFYEIVLTKKQQIQIFLDLFLFQTSFDSSDFEIKKFIKKRFFTLKIIDTSLESFFEFNSFFKFLELKNIKMEIFLCFVNTKTDRILKGHSFLGFI